MLKELKNAMRITINSHDALLANFLMAGANDLAIAGVVTTETVSFTIGTDDAVVDTSTMQDPKLKQAVLTSLLLRLKGSGTVRARTSSTTPTRCRRAS